MTQYDSLPIQVSHETRQNPYIMQDLAQRAFRLADYDMSPDDAVNAAIARGYLVVKPPVQPIKIKRMPGNGSFA